MEKQTRNFEQNHLKSTFFKPTIQKKLSVGASNDSHEIEADSMANKVMQMREPSRTNISHTGALVQRKCASCEQEEKIQTKPLAETIQRVSNSTKEASTAPSHVEKAINKSRGGGSIMDQSTRNFMETRFGTDFSTVRIHTGNEAIQMSRELNAQAFTVGNDIYFNQGKYSPNTDSGKHLLAHELTHTIQQSGSIERKIQMQRSSRRSCTASNVENFSIFNHINKSITIPRGCRGTLVFTTISVPNCGGMGCTGPDTFSVTITNGENHITHNLRTVGGHCGDAEQPNARRSRSISLSSGTNNIRIDTNSHCEDARLQIRMEVTIR